MKIIVGATPDRQVMLQIFDDESKMLVSINIAAAAAVGLATEIEKCAALAQGLEAPSSTRN